MVVRLRLRAGMGQRQPGRTALRDMGLFSKVWLPSLGAVLTTSGQLFAVQAQAPTASGRFDPQSEVSSLVLRL